MNKTSWMAIAGTSVSMMRRKAFAVSTSMPSTTKLIRLSVFVSIENFNSNTEMVKVKNEGGNLNNSAKYG